MGKGNFKGVFHQPVNQQINAVEWGDAIDDGYGIAALSFFKAKIAAWGASTTLPILKKSSFEKIEVPVPPITLQEKFSQRIRTLDELRVSNDSALEQLGALFHSLQHRAFRGEL